VREIRRQNGRFFRRQPEHKIARKASAVPFHCLVKTEGGDAIHRGNFRIEHDALSAKNVDMAPGHLQRNGVALQSIVSSFCHSLR
jgi:hypothetical protein